MEIIKLFRVNIFMPVTEFPHLTIESLVSSGGFSKKPTAKIGDFAETKGREKTRMAKVVRCFRQVTWHKKA